MTKKRVFSHPLFLLTPVDYRLRPLLGVFRAYPARSLRDWARKFEFLVTLIYYQNQNGRSSSNDSLPPIGVPVGAE